MSWKLGLEVLVPYMQYISNSVLGNVSCTYFSFFLTRGMVYVSPFSKLG